MYEREGHLEEDAIVRKLRQALGGCAFLGSPRGGTAKALYSLIKDNTTSILPTNTQIKIIADRECGATNDKTYH